MGRPLSRRTFLAGVGLAGLGGLWLMAPGAAGATPWPVDPARPLDPRRFPNSSLIWSWQQRLAQWCPPFTGSPSHAAYVDWLDRGLQEARLSTHRRSFTFSYWEPQSYGLYGPQGREIPVVGYQPYSGETPLWGISAPLHFAGTAPNLNYEGAAGKIVVYEAPLQSFQPLRPTRRSATTRRSPRPRWPQQSWRRPGRSCKRRA